MRRLLRNALYICGVGALCLTPLQASTSSLADAVMRGDKETVRAALKSGADVNAAQGDGMTALHWAALKNDAEVARMLIKAGANVTATTRLGGYTPLLLAARNGSVAVIDELVTAGANPNAATTNGTTALMMAAAAGRADGVRALLDHGADANAKEVRGETALMFAAASGRVDAIKVLASRGAEVDATMRAVDLTVTEQAMQEPAGATTGKNINENESAGAATAKYANGAEPAGRTRRGQKVNPYNLLVAAQGGLTPLLFASREGHVEAATALLDAGAVVNKPSAGDGTTPLLMATINGNFDLAKLFLDKGADPRIASENGVTPLFAAVNCYWSPRAAYPQPRAFEQQRMSYLELMSALLDKGADPNARVNKKPWYSGYNFDRSGIDEAGATTFWRAAYAGDVDAMRLLVARGADPYIPTMKSPVRAGAANETQRAAGKDQSGLPPIPVGGPDVPALHAAAGVGYGVGYSGNSHHYSPNGMLPAVKYMVEELHMDVNATDSLGNNAIHHAAARGDTEMVLYLVAKGANPLLVNREGLTTVDMANAPVQKTTPFPDTIAVLEKMGAKNNHKCMSC